LCIKYNKSFNGHILILSLNPLAAAVLLALLACIPILLRSLKLAAAVDLMLGGLAGALVGGRALHVLLNWDYFASHLNEALYGGGLDWHGAAIGGLAGVWVALHFLAPCGRAAVLDGLALALPLLVLALWAGCGAAACGYGAEVATLADYPAFAVSESSDVYGIVAPRWNTALFGMALAVLVGLVMLIFTWRGWLTGRRLWLALALLSVGMFAIGFVRGDTSPMLFGFRIDQLLDLGILMISLRLSARS
jgi:prolipoprotein diacylglyceryltransferase